LGGKKGKGRNVFFFAPGDTGLGENVLPKKNYTKKQAPAPPNARFLAMTNQAAFLLGRSVAKNFIWISRVGPFLRALSHGGQQSCGQRKSGQSRSR